MYPAPPLSDNRRALPIVLPCVVTPQPPSSSGGRGQRRRQKQQDELRAACAERVKTVVPLGETMLDDIQTVLEVNEPKDRSSVSA